MKKIFLSTLCCLALFSVHSQTKNFIDQPFLETTAKVDTLVSPDRIYLNIYLTESDSKGKTSVEELENKMAAQLKSLGIDLEEQLKLGDLSSNFKKYFLKQNDVLKSKNFSLLVYDAFSAGRVIQSLEKIGISNIEIDRTLYSKIEELRITLKSKAIIKAKLQGDALLQPLDQSLGKIIFISDINTRYYNNLNTRSAGIQVTLDERKSNNLKPLDVEFDKIKVECQINAKFIID